MVAGSLLYVLDPTYPFYAAVAMNFVNVVVTLTMPKTEQYATNSDSDDQESFTIVDAVPIIRRRLTKPDIRWFVLFMALFFGVSGSAKTYIQPITVNSLKTSLGSVFSSHGVPEATLLGLLYASFTIVSGIASDQASKLEEVLGLRRALLVVPFSMAFLFVVPVVFPIMVFPMFFGMRIAKSLLRPISGQYLNDHIESVGRATILSAVSMVYALFRIPFTLGSGLVADYASPRVAVAAMGVLFVVAGVTLYAWRSPVRGDRETRSRGTVRTE